MTTRALPPKEFTGAMSHMVCVGHNDWTGYARERFQDTRNGANTLLSLKERLRFTDEPPAIGAATIDPVPEELGSAVIFLVHGRNKGIREEVARFLEKTGEHEVVILNEQASSGRTLIEKFETRAGNARYAVVLLTGDDEGGAKGEAQRPAPDRTSCSNWGSSSASSGASDSRCSTKLTLRSRQT